MIIRRFRLGQAGAVNPYNFRTTGPVCCFLAGPGYSCLAFVSLVLPGPWLSGVGYLFLSLWSSWCS